MQNVKCKIDVDSFGIFDCENSDSMWNEPPTVGWEEAVMFREHLMLDINRGELRESARGGVPAKQQFKQSKIAKQSTSPAHFPLSTVH